MSAFPESGRSDHWKITKSKGRFRPRRVSHQIPVNGRSHTESALGAIYVGVLPFVISEVLLIAILVAVPGLALWLPRTMG